jgi:hypothetical protein
MLVLISLLVVLFMNLVSGEMAMSSNVHVAKGALYAADAGIRMAEQNIANVGKKRLDSLLTIYSGHGPVIPAPSTIFPQGNLITTASNPNFNASTAVVFTDSILSVQTQIYNYQYTISSTGQQGVRGTRIVQSTGQLRLSAGRGSFADYLLYTNIHTMPDGSPIWFTSSGYFEGRVHTNGTYRFQGRPTFEDLVTSKGSTAWYYNNGSPLSLNDDHNKTLDVPNFYGGFKRSQPQIDLPANMFSQQNAALGLDPLSTTAPDNTTIRAQLGLSGSTAPPNGVYIPNTLLSVTGGIYVQGNLDACVMSVDGTGNQVYTLTQGGVTTTITVDQTLNTTTVQASGPPTIYSGKPRGILYTQGSVNSFGGPDRAGPNIPPALADNTAMLLATTGDIVIQSDVTYNDYFNGNSVLGMLSTSSVRIGTSAPNDIQINSFLMAAGSSGSFSVDNYNMGSPRGSVHLRGGIVAQYYGAFGQFNSSGAITHGYARDFRFDDRGIVPPYFPTTSVFVANLPKAHTQTWKEM